ncbi:WD40 repeat-like protein, partial [Heliocybe sulcata]
MSSSKVLQNSAHGPGTTYLAFSRDGSLAYTGGNDTLVRVWNTKEGADQEPGIAVEAGESITAIAVGEDCWLSGSEDTEVRRYLKDETVMEGLVTSGNGAAIRSLAIDPKGKRVAVSSEELDVKLIDLEDPLKISLLSGHIKCVRRITWHPSGSLLTTSGADGKVIVWDVSEDEPKQEKIIEGVIPAVSDPESPEFAHDCSVIWHTSGQYFYAATRTHEIVTISRSTWAKSSTFSDDSMLGDVTALALSANGLYLASSSQAGIFIWSTQNRRVLYKHPPSPNATVTQLAWSPTQNLLAWTDSEGILTRWPQPIPPSAPDPVKRSGATSVTTVPMQRKAAPSLFDDDAVDDNKGKDGAEPEPEVDLDNDDWILDDIGDGLQDEPEEQRSRKDGLVKEMVSVTKAQPAFQPGSTPWTNKKRYLDYNMIGVIEATDQDTHHIVNVEFHDKTARKGMHFTDHFKYDLASLGERGALFACPSENDHLGHVVYKPYGTWASQGEWTYELPKDVRAIGVSAGGPRATKSQRVMSDGELQGYGNVVVATNQHEITFLTGSGIERISIGLDGDFVTMVAGTEFVFVVTRDGATTIDGSQNLLGTMWEFDEFSVLQKQKLPIPKGSTLKWIGITQEGAPAIYDSKGVLYTMPRFRIPLRASWVRSLDTNTLERREGKDESYWPVGVTADSIMCLILKGRQEYPGFPRPLIQELPLRYPFRRKDPKEGPLEEHIARESMLLNIKRDALGDDLTSDEISRRELALDKELIQLIQHACKNDKLPRALELTGMLHHIPSFDMAIKVAGFYHLVGLREKMEALKEDRMSDDRLEGAREKRKR